MGCDASLAPSATPQPRNHLVLLTCAELLN